MNKVTFYFSTLFMIFLCTSINAQKPNFSYSDVFDIQYVSDPQISPDGDWVVYRRMGFDVMKDRSHGNLWKIKTDGSEHEKLTAREVSESGAKWSPSGNRIAFTSSTNEGSEVYIYWVNSGNIAKISQLPFSPGSLTWSPDGKQ